MGEGALLGQLAGGVAGEEQAAEGNVAGLAAAAEGGLALGLAIVCRPLKGDDEGATSALVWILAPAPCRSESA